MTQIADNRILRITKLLVFLIMGFVAVGGVVVVNPAEIARVVAADFIHHVAAVGRRLHRLIRCAAKGLRRLRALALLPVVFHLALDGSALPDVAMDVRGLPGELILRLKNF